MKEIRPFIFWLFVLLFFLTSAGVLFYTFGYRFSLERGLFIYTGSITVDSNPPDVTITLDGEVVPENHLGFINNSTHIPGVPPGEHFLSVTAPGYTTWEKKVVVESGRSTEFWNVLLGRQEPVIETLASTEGAVKIFPSPDANIVAVAKKTGDELTVSVYDITDQTGEQVFSLPDAEILSENEDGLEWAPDGEALLVPVRQEGLVRYFVVDTQTTASFELSGLTPDGRRKYTRWQPEARHGLFYLDSGTLYFLDAEATERAPVSLRSGIQAYDLSSQWLYLLSSENGIISRIPVQNAAGADPRQITTTPITVRQSGNYALSVYDENRMALLEKVQGELWLYNQGASADEPPLRPLLASGAKGMQFSDDGKKLLYFSENEVSVAFLREWEVQPTREAGSFQQIIRLSQPLRFVQWSKDYEHVLYAVDKSVKVAELDNRDRRNIFDLVNLEARPLQILSRFEENNVYFIEDRPDRTLRLIQFPTPTTFLGFGN